LLAVAAMDVSPTLSHAQQQFAQVSCEATSVAEGAGLPNVGASGASAALATGTGDCYVTPSPSWQINPGEVPGPPDTGWPPVSAVVCQELLREVTVAGVVGTEKQQVDATPNCQPTVGAPPAALGPAQAWQATVATPYTGLATAGTCGIGGAAGTCATGNYFNVAAVIACLGSSDAGAPPPVATPTGCTWGSQVPQEAGLCDGAFTWATSCDEEEFRVGV
jgi:hypothetical protein